MNPRLQIPGRAAPEGEALAWDHQLGIQILDSLCDVRHVTVFRCLSSQHISHLPGFLYGGSNNTALRAMPARRSRSNPGL